MPAIITVEEAQAKLKALIDQLAPGEVLVLTQNQQPVAKLVGERPTRPPRPAPGLGKGSILYMAPDFDEPLEEFKEYMVESRDTSNRARSVSDG
jgi:antitoxin (DNA-binding transcriptional repressor) of toxin-antitoxin stability system